MTGKLIGSPESLVPSHGAAEIGAGAENTAGVRDLTIRTPMPPTNCWCSNDSATCKKCWPERAGSPRQPSADWKCDCGFEQNSAYSIRCLKCLKYRDELTSLSQHPVPAPKETRLLGMNETELANIELGEHPGPTPRSEYQVDRYRNGRKMAEGAKVTATSANEALEKAIKLFYPLMQGETFVIEDGHPGPTKGGGE